MFNVHCIRMLLKPVEKKELTTTTIQLKILLSVNIRMQNEAHAQKLNAVV